MTRGSAPARRVVYTDGGAIPNPGTGGWGAVIIDPDSDRTEELSGGELQTTNNRMELTAAIRALEHLAEQGHSMKLEVHTDSTYLRKGITQWIAGWMRRNWQRRDSSGKLLPVKNVDLWKRLAELDSRHQVSWHWLKGHAGHQHNERADELAALEIDRLRSQRHGRSTADPGSLELERNQATADIEASIKVVCQKGLGSWAVLLVAGTEEEAVIGTINETTANRTELEAALEVFERVDPGQSLTVRSTDYLRRGAAEWLDGWRRRGWKTGSGDPVKNVDLWQRIDAELRRRRVRFLPLEKESDVARELTKRAEAARS